MSDEITTAPKATKPGFKTSEFWLAALTMIIGTLIASGAVAETSAFGKALAFAMGALASLGYSFSRASLKKAG